VPTMVLSEAFRLSLFLVVRGGIGFLERLGAPSTRLTGFWILTLEPERLENQPVIAGNESSQRLSTGAQAACCFKCSASKRTPFFQTIKVMAAILRARVRRAIVGFMPLATKAA
jgi:hypothetical protein